MTAQRISWWGFVVFSIILLGFAALVLWKMFRDPEALRGLISEPPSPSDIGEPKGACLAFSF